MTSGAQPSEIDVTVVIPTMGRPTLTRAIETAARQDGVRTWVVVMVDGRRTDGSSIVVPEGCTNVAIVVDGDARGGAHLRHSGTARATSRFVAYLDDDDYWVSDKLQRQLEVALRSPQPDRVVIGSRIRYVNPDGTSTDAPTTLFVEGRVEDYLFRSRRLSASRNLMHTSTMFASTALAQESNWDPELTRHQDWDFLVRIAALPNVSVIHMPESLAMVGMAEVGGISRSTDWSSSLSWVRQFRDRWDPKTYSDFLAGQPLRYALGARSFTGVKETAREFRGAPLPSLNNLILGMSGLASGTMFRKAMSRSSRSSAADRVEDADSVRRKGA